jgi:hypothetical protein
MSSLWFQWFEALRNYEGETVLYAVQGWAVTVTPFVVRFAGRRGTEVGRAGAAEVARNSPSSPPTRSWAGRIADLSG